MRLAAVDAADVRDVDDAGDAAPGAAGVLAGVQLVDDHRQACGVVHQDLAVAVERTQRAAAGARGVHDLAVQLDVATADLRAIELEAVVDHVVVRADVAVVADQLVQPTACRGARGPTGRVAVGPGERHVDFETVAHDVVADAPTGHIKVNVGLGLFVSTGGGVVVSGHRRIQRALRQAKEAGAAGQLRGGGQVDFPVLDAALHQAVDVQVTRTQEHAAVGDDAAADRCTKVLDRTGIAANVEEVVHVALHEVTVLRLDVHRAGADVAVRQHAARRAAHCDRATQVADVAGQLDVRRRRQHLGSGTVRVVGAGDVDRGLRCAAGVARQHRQVVRCGATAVDAVDVGRRVDQHIIEAHRAAIIAVDREVAQLEEVRRVVDDIDPCIARCVELPTALQHIALGADVAELHRDVVDGDEVRDGPVGADLRLVRQIASQLRQVGGRAGLTVDRRVDGRGIDRNHIHKAGCACKSSRFGDDGAGRGADGGARGGRVVDGRADSGGRAVLAAVCLLEGGGQGPLVARDRAVVLHHLGRRRLDRRAAAGDTREQRLDRAGRGADTGLACVDLGLQRRVRGRSVLKRQHAGAARFDLGQQVRDGGVVRRDGAERGRVERAVRRDGGQLRRVVTDQRLRRKVSGMGGIETIKRLQAGVDVPVGRDQRRTLGGDRAAAGADGVAGAHHQCRSVRDQLPAAADLAGLAHQLHLVLLDLRRRNLVRTRVAAAARIDHLLAVDRRDLRQAEFGQFEHEEVDLGLVGATRHVVRGILLHQAAQLADPLLDVGSNALAQLDRVGHTLGRGGLHAPQHLSVDLDVLAGGGRDVAVLIQVAALRVGQVGVAVHRNGRQVARCIGQFDLESQRGAAVDASHRDPIHVHDGTATHAGRAANHIERHVTATEQVADAAGRGREGFAVEVLADALGLGGDQAFVGIQRNVFRRLDPAARRERDTRVVDDVGLCVRVGVDRDRRLVPQVDRSIGINACGIAA